MGTRHEPHAIGSGSLIDFVHALVHRVVIGQNSPVCANATAYVLAAERNDSFCYKFT